MIHLSVYLFMCVHDWWSNITKCVMTGGRIESAEMVYISQDTILAATHFLLSGSLSACVSG